MGHPVVHLGRESKLQKHHSSEQPGAASSSPSSSPGPPEPSTKMLPPGLYPPQLASQAEALVPPCFSGMAI